MAALAAVLTIGGVLGFGTPSARAQGFSLSINSGFRGYGYPGYGYPGYGVPSYGYPGSFYSGSGYYGGYAPSYGYSGYGGYGYAPYGGVIQAPYGAFSGYGYQPNVYPISPYGYQGYSFGTGFTTRSFYSSPPYRFLPW
jgi:hypothetical protein